MIPPRPARSVSDLERRFREVLVQLALCSNGKTSNWSPSGSGDVDYTPRLGLHDAPERALARRYEQATSGEARRAILEDAIAELEAIRRAPAAAVLVGETKAERDARIVTHGEGIPAREVAISARCGIRDVWAARAANGRETELGRPATNDGGSLSARQRRTRVLELMAQGLTARGVSQVLGVSYSTVRRDLGRKA
jgi:DNA-binding CsgD family transcriptional regulator